MGGMAVDYFIFCSNDAPWTSSGRCRPSFGSTTYEYRDYATRTVHRASRQQHFEDGWMRGRYTLIIDKSSIEKHFGAKFYIARASFVSNSTRSG